MTYIHLCDDFDKTIDAFHEFKVVHSDDIVTTNYDSVTKSVFLTVENGDAHDFMKRDHVLVFDRLHELGCNRYTLSESDIEGVSLIRVCDTYPEVKAVYDKELVDREDLIKYGSIIDKGHAVIKFKDDSYEILISTYSGDVVDMEEIEARR